MEMCICWTFLLFTLLTFPPVQPYLEKQAGNYFEFSPELKTRQCQWTIQVLQEFNFSAEYNEIPPFQRKFTGVPQVSWASITPFQVLVYVQDEGSVVDGPLDMHIFPRPFCRRGFCLQCLLKGSKVCWGGPAPVYYVNMSIPGGDHLTGTLDNGDFFCLSRSCNATDWKCDPVEKVDVNPNCTVRGSCPCPPSAKRGLNCYFTNTTFRSRLLRNGKLLEYNRGQGQSPFSLFTLIIFLFIIL